MPNIRQYTNPIEGLQPSERGVSAFSQAAQGSAIAGRSIASAYGELGRQIGSTIAEGGEAYQQHLTRQEISKGAADLATLQDNLTQSWNKTASEADPNDQTVRQRFLELQEQSLNAYAENFQTKAGQDWARQQIGHLRTHMFEKTAADEASRAGYAALQNLDVLKNRASNLVMTDPTALDATLGMIDRSVEAIAGADPNMDPSVVAKLKTELRQTLKDDVAKAAAIGAIDRNPAAAKELLASGRFADYLDGDTIKALDSYADAKVHAVELEKRAQEAEQRRQEKQQADAASAAISASIIQKDGSLAIPPDYYSNLVKYAQLPGADAGEARAMINMGRAITEDLEKGIPAVTDPQTFSTYMNRLQLQAEDPNFLTNREVYAARAAGRLSDKDTTMMLGAIERLTKDPEEKASKKDFHAFVASYKSYITKSSMLSVDAYGDQRYYEFQRDAEQYHDWARTKGLSEEAIRKNIVGALPRYQIGQASNRTAVAQQASGTPLKPLPQVQQPGQSQPAPSAAAKPPSKATFDEMDKY